MTQRKMKLLVDIESRHRSGHIHPSGSSGIVVERLGDDAWLVEVRVPDPTLVGDGWYETLDVREHEFELVEEAAPTPEGEAISQNREPCEHGEHCHRWHHPRCPRGTSAGACTVTHTR